MRKGNGYTVIASYSNGVRPALHCTTKCEARRIARAECEEIICNCSNVTSVGANIYTGTITDNVEPVHYLSSKSNLRNDTVECDELRWIF